MIADSRESVRGLEERSRGAHVRVGSRGGAYAACAFLSMGFHAWLLFIWPMDFAFEPAEHAVVGGVSAIEVALVEALPASEELTVDAQETVQPPEQVESSETMPEVKEEPPQPIPSPPPEVLQEVIQQEHVQEIQPQPVPASTARAKRKSASSERNDLPAGGKNSSGTAKHGSSASATSGSPMTQAAYLFNPHPLYPEASRKAGHTGVVIMRVSVSERGRVSALRIIKSSGYALLDDRARTTVSRWTFKPARREGRPVSTQVDVPIRFSLDR